MRQHSRGKKGAFLNSLRGEEKRKKGQLSLICKEKKRVLLQCMGMRVSELFEKRGKGGETSILSVAEEKGSRLSRIARRTIIFQIASTIEKKRRKEGRETW